MCVLAYFVIGFVCCVIGHLIFRPQYLEDKFMLSAGMIIWPMALFVGAFYVLGKLAERIARRIQP